MCKSTREEIEIIADQIYNDDQKHEEYFLNLLKKYKMLSSNECIYIMQASISRSFTKIIDKYENVFNDQTKDLNLLFEEALLDKKTKMFRYILELAKNKDYPENNETFLSMALKMYNYQIINYIMEEVGDTYVLNKIEVYRLKDYLRYVKVDRKFIKLMFNHLTEDDKVNLYFDLLNK